MTVRRGLPFGLVACFAGAAVAQPLPPPPPPPPPPPVSPDRLEARALGDVVLTALATGEARVLAGAMRAPVEVDVELALSSACQKKFKPTDRIARARLGAFARCLADLKVDVRGDLVAVFAEGPGFVVTANSDDVAVRLELRKVKSAWKVVAIGVEDLTVDDDGGVVGGVEGGGVVGGVIGGTAPPPPPPPPPPGPRIVPAPVLEGQRVAGDKLIVPDEKTRDAIAAAKKSQVSVPVKVCLDATGAVVTATALKASGFPTYDRLVETTIRDTWKYKPFMINGQAAAICGLVSFIYKQTP